jgi:uncharacterized caspase-like protein
MPPRSPIAVRAWFTLTLMLVALLGGGAPQAAVAATLDGPRVALVIGNAAYRKDPLLNPLNDARAIGDSLRQLGFKVISLENASQKQMHDAVRQFGDALQGGVGLFYYAGHGVQVKGRNYLVPVDADIGREDEVPYKAVDVGLVLDKMEAARNPLNIVILDACRNNPFARGSRSGAGGGLAQMDAPTGSIIAFATAPGAEAADGSASNGLYTGQLLRFMNTPGLKVEDVFKRTRVAVKQASGGKQIPWESTSLEGDFYFAGGAAAGAATQAPSLDDELWQLVSDAGHPSAYRAYLEKFPQGRHAPQARALAAQSAAAPARVAPAPANRDGAPAAGGFSFSAEEAKMDRATAPGRDRAFQQTLAALSCEPARRQAGVMLALDEPPGGRFASALGQRLQQAGMKVGTGGGYVVKGTISAQAQRHRALNLDEVSVNAAVAMSTASGRPVADSVARAESYAGGDASAVVGELMQAQAGEVATQLLTQLCRP